MGQKAPRALTQPPSAPHPRRGGKRHRKDEDIYHQLPGWFPGSRVLGCRGFAGDSVECNGTVLNKRNETREDRGSRGRVKLMCVEPHREGLS